MEDYKFIIIKNYRTRKPKVYQNNGADLFFLRGDVSKDLLSRKEIMEQNPLRSTVTFSNLDR